MAWDSNVGHEGEAMSGVYRSGWRRVVVVGLCLAALLPLAAQPPPGAGAEAAPRVFRIACTEYPPFVVLGDSGQLQGISVELADLVFDRLGVPHDFFVYPWPRAWMMVEKGAVDGVLDISYAESREACILYTEAQRKGATSGGAAADFLWNSQYVFFVLRKALPSVSFTSLEQVRSDGYRVGVNRGYTYSPEFLAAGLNLIQYDTVEESLQALIARQIDLYACDKTVGLAVRARLAGGEDTVTFLPHPIFSKGYFFGFAKASSWPDLGALQTRFLAELDAVRHEGKYYEILHRYGADAAARSPADRPFVFVCEQWKPFEFEEDGQVKGINSEIVATIMGRLGVPHVIHVYPWSRAWMLAEKGKADGVLSISYKEEREPILYYTPEQRAFATTGILPPDYLWLSEYVFFVKTKNATLIQFNSYEQLKMDGWRIGTNRDYTYSADFLAAGFEGPVYSSAREGLQALVAEEIDLYPMDRTVGLAELADMGLEASVSFLPKPMFTKPYLAPFCRNSDYPGIEPLMQDFYRELRLMRESGECEAIRQRHLK